MKYDETHKKPFWYPRHPGVTIIDTSACVTIVLWLTQSHHWTTTIYLGTLFTLYAVSAIYHHVHYREWLGKLDHIMIFYVISITALPFWGYIIPFDTYWLGPLIITSICVFGTTVKFVSFLPRFVSGAVYLLASAPMVLYFIAYQHEISTPYNILWLFGLGLFSVQLSVYTFKWPDLVTELFGFREIQHVVLLGATSLHSYVAVALTS